MIRVIILAALAPFTNAYAQHFDHYKLALSWSPTYCLLQNQQKNTNYSEQCSSAAQYRFIVHGLWPQFENNVRQAFCYTSDAHVPEHLVQMQKTIVPDKKLILHQWRKHGSCTGMDAENYFFAMRVAYQAVKIPDIFNTPSTQSHYTLKEIKNSFMAINANLKPNMMQFMCRGQKFSEIRLCMSKSLEFQPCTDMRDTCPQTGIQLPPAFQN